MVHINKGRYSHVAFYFILFSKIRPFLSLIYLLQSLMNFAPLAAIKTHGRCFLVVFYSKEWSNPEIMHHLPNTLAVCSTNQPNFMDGRFIFTVFALGSR